MGDLRLEKKAQKKLKYAVEAKVIDNRVDNAASGGKGDCKSPRNFAISLRISKKRLCILERDILMEYILFEKRTVI